MLHHSYPNLLTPKYPWMAVNSGLSKEITMYNKNLQCYNGECVCMYINMSCVFAKEHACIYVCLWMCQFGNFMRLSSMSPPDIIGCFPLHLLQPAANGASRWSLCTMTPAECEMFFSTGTVKQLSDSACLYTACLCHWTQGLENACVSAHAGFPTQP